MGGTESLIAVAVAAKAGEQIRVIGEDGAWPAFHGDAVTLWRAPTGFTTRVPPQSLATALASRQH